jgi:hypothetical protein
LAEQLLTVPVKDEADQQHQCVVQKREHGGLVV